MVLFKRKKVEFLPHPEGLKYAPKAEIWEIAQTGELFTQYDQYLDRSNSLAKLQATMVSHSSTHLRARFEQLVGFAHDQFKHDFFPREQVIATVEGGEKVEGTIREKTSYPARQDENGALQPVSKYIVALEADPSKKRTASEAVVDNYHLSRDRRHFSKVLLRSFLKGALTKETWQGAPWTVKEKLAKDFNLPTEIPPHLQQHVLAAQRKAMTLQKKVDNGDQTSFLNFLQDKNKKMDIRPAPGKGQKHQHRFIQQDMSRFLQPLDPNYPQYQQYHQQMHQQQAQIDGQPQYLPGQMHPSHQYQQPTRAVPTHNFHNGNFQPIMNGPYGQRVEVVIDNMPAPTPMKFPMEDLDVPPRRDAAPRPSIKFFSEDTPTGEESEDCHNPGLKLQSVGPLLEIWNTLNVLGEVFVMDSFVLDDFAEAMRYSSQDAECELLSEVHCAVLKQLVNEKGEVQVSLPDFDDEESGDENEQEDVSEDPPTPEPIYKRTTRSSLKKEEVAALREPTPVEENKQVHRAAEVLGERTWIKRLQERDFRDGGWQTILVGFLHQMSQDERQKPLCERILAVLAPMDQEPSAEVVAFQYINLDVNLRIDLLEMIVMQAVRTKAVREHLEAMSLQMTDLRKKKIEQQRLKKDHIEKLHELDEQRKTLQAEVQAAQPQTEVNGDVDITLPDIPAEPNGNAETSENSEDEAPRTLRRGMDRKRKREVQNARKEKGKKAKAAAPKLSKAELKLKKTIEEIEQKKLDIMKCEDDIIEFTDDLRETDCQRTRPLGRDRFCNRYIWFERNGMPFAGTPGTSTEHYGYANGRLWIQGPDFMDREGLFEWSKEDQAKYKALYEVTVLERKEKEEGSTHLNTAEQWGYIDDPAVIDQLLGWLDERGHREKALKKEIVLWRDMITECMKKMRAHLDEVEAKKTAGEEQSAMRVSTRTKSYTAGDVSKWQCLAWRNTEALRELGMLHSDGLKKKRQKGVAEVKGKAAKSKGRK
ncbi:hypothetical protein EG328_001783 [Venturia inaequalis]|uniref:DDT domain-containing protein n=1 Tax=Venturia inaequalis TaxID=5025 RepID=A0A8H3UY70_VENIN|nr:hypothetical protein EG328_001783 [Venturia inaequalis]KAE9991443.1 hypothetical protein EG327_011672 [Venturia inaequalis]